MSVNKRAGVRRPFLYVDVFSDTPFLGNPLAVVFDADGLDEVEMQRFAHWCNQSETVFIMAPTLAGADYQIRIFTPTGELPFAGHPTLGACHAWLERGGKPAQDGLIIQQSAIGRVKVERSQGKLWFQAPPLRRNNPDREELHSICTALGISLDRVAQAQWLDNGVNWFGLQLVSTRDVVTLKPQFDVLRRMGTHVGVLAVDRGPRNDVLGIEVRAFTPAMGINEDSATGSLNASLAQWLSANGVVPDSYVAVQGKALGREGRIHIRVDDPRTYVGGDCVTCVAGEITI